MIEGRDTPAGSSCFAAFGRTVLYPRVSIVSTGLDRVMSLVNNLLDEVLPVNDELTTATSSDKFPSWTKDEDMKLLQADGVTADAVVAADGSGNYLNVMDAILAAPESSMERHVIYVKKGVYNENVEIKKKKWNIMIIGDGMDATVISGKRNFVDGWTTFRSATFGIWKLCVPSFTVRDMHDSRASNFDLL
ncbi:hypothetical protein RYX36_034771 [Vicia faba]